MPKHVVICKYCKESFDTEQEEYKKESNRYAHLKCWEEQQKKVEYTEKIHKKMRDLLGEGYSRNKVDRQIKEYLDEGKTASGIFRTLEYWYDVKKADPSKAYGGIGIVPHIYLEARTYWKQEMLKKERFQSLGNEGKKHLEDLEENRPIQHKRYPIAKPKKINYFQLD